MKQNQAGLSNVQNHPSFQSKFKPPKPSIKVDYKVIHELRLNNVRRKQGKKNFPEKVSNRTFLVSTSNENKENFKSKRISSTTQYKSGKFIESQYYPNQVSLLNSSRNTCRKGKTTDSTLKYQQSKSLQRIIKDQNVKKREPSCFIGELKMSKLKTQRSQITDKSKLSVQKILLNERSRISQKSKLPSYSNEGIKDIVQYEHAGDYREEKLTQKCTTGRVVKEIRDRFKAFDQIHDFDFRKRVNTLSNQVRLTKGLR